MLIWIRTLVSVSGQVLLKLIEMLQWIQTRFREMEGGLLGAERSRCCWPMGAYLCTLLTQWEHFNLIPLFL